MKLNILCASYGYQWLRQANNIIRANRGLFFCHILLYIVAIMVSLFISLNSPIIFGLFIGILSVIFSTIIMQICHRSLTPDAPETAMTLTQLWGKTLKNKRIVMLAFITTLVLSFLFLISSFITNLLFPELMQQSQEFLAHLENTPDAKLSTEFFISALPYYAMQQASGILPQVITFLLFSMTPALIYWSDISYSQAMFYNLMACLKNWRTWLAWFLALIMIFAVLPVAGLAFLYLLMQVAPPILAVIATPIVLIFILGLILLSMVIVPASYYFAYKDCFIQKA